jgi:transcriptional regulator with XRE-family HTH domain
MSSDIKLLLAKKLRQLRKKYGFTQQKLAELSGVDYKHIQLLESKNPPATRINTLEKIAKAFGMDSAQLLDFGERN